MGDDLVQSCVIVDLAQVSVVLNGNQRIAFKHFRRKLTCRRPERFCVKGYIISIEEFLYNVQDRTFSGTALTIKNKELLYLLAVTSDHGSHGPFDLLPLFIRVQCADQLVISVVLSVLKRIGKTP